MDSNSNSNSDSDRELVAIAAVAENGVIGKNGDMPWHIPEDMDHFKEQTTGHPMIMGRVTYESILELIDEPLPGRTSVVLTSRDFETPENVVLAADLEEALSEATTAARERHDTARIFVAGGATVYEQLLPETDRLIITEVHDDPDGDTYFPAIDPERWRETSREDHEDDGFSFVEYVRRE
ncbi:dihydrofolate reductase [Natronoglomus mannanivorans]|uniref:dihydrofolate reductase n=1 Tax=Natronoglomus mannanivorans TaxID=2979990 RepID=A0AAP3E2K1_9EURY|nr:dihydrofolate reductase [Halobacteria archaeon AArc-xg1-1]